jgi:RNA polymerase sigma-70 factor, ECF subfamily
MSCSLSAIALAAEPQRPPVQLVLIEGGAGFRQQLQAVAPQLFPQALRLTRNVERARDLVQDAILRALQFENTFVANTNLKAWLRQILYSVFVTQCRRQRREGKALQALGSDPCGWLQPEPASVMQCLLPNFEAALSQLPESFGRTLLLVDLKDLSYKEAALELGVPVGTVMSRLFRARRLLGEHLQGVAA